MPYPHDSFYYVTKDGKYLTIDGWGRPYWTDKFPGAVAPTREHAESLASGQTGYEIKFQA